MQKPNYLEAWAGRIEAETRLSGGGKRGFADAGRPASYSAQAVRGQACAALAMLARFVDESMLLGAVSAIVAAQDADALTPEPADALRAAMAGRSGA